MLRLRKRLSPLAALLAAATFVTMAGAATASDEPACGQAAKSAPVRTARVHPRTPAKPVRPAAHTAPGAAGMRVAIDPATGLLVKPTAQQRQSLGVSSSPGLERSSAGLVIVTLPDGTQLCDLQGRFQEYLVARKDASGALRTDCVQTSETAGRMMKTPVAPRTGLVRASEAERVKE